MKIADDQPSGLTALDRPNSYIGRSVPRPNLARLTQGRGQYVSDIVLQRMVHVAFVRSPHAHARIKKIESAQADDACALVGVDYDVLPVVTDAETALDAETPVIHPELGDNLTFERTLNAGDPDKGFAEADAIVETTFV